jgi:hypothetical protein
MGHPLYRLSLSYVGTSARANNRSIGQQLRESKD